MAADAGFGGNEYITINGNVYTLTKDNENISLARYNKKYKTWVRINFAGISQRNTIIDSLTKQYIERMTKEPWIGS